MDYRTWGLVSGLWILGLAGTASADDIRQAEVPTLRVLVLNQAGVRAEVVRAAEHDAGSIYSAAGVRVVWVEQTGGPTQAFDVAVKIVGTKLGNLPNAVDDLTLGFAAVNSTAEGQRGRIVWVLFDRVEAHAARRHIQISRLCGLVIAHEIGHLLLPAGHSEHGLMQATLELRCGWLQYFTEPQADAIRTRLTYVRAY